MNQRMDRQLYLYVMKQLAEELPEGLDDEYSPEHVAEFGARLEDFIKLGYELTDPESCEVEIYSANQAIKEVLSDKEWAQLLDVISDKGDIQLIRISVFGKPLLETGRFHHCPNENAGRFMELPASTLKGVVKGLVQLVRDHDMNVIDAYRGNGPGKVDVNDTFAQLLTEVLEDEIEETVSEFRQSLMAEVTASQFTPWGPPSGSPTDPLGGGDDNG